MAENKVYVQGNYVDVHDNGVVNLHIDKATVALGATDSDKAQVLTGNNEFMQMMRRAVEMGFCRPDDWRYRWEVKMEAAYFASEASHYFNLSTRRDHHGDTAISWKPFEALFGLKDMRLTYNDYKQSKSPLKRKAEIDSLFKAKR